MFYKQLHGLRGLASLMVFLAHITAGYSLHVNNITGLRDIPGDLQYYISNIGTFGVEIFFFLSGFVIFKSSLSETSGVFFTRRFFRIYPVFLLFSLMFIFGNVLTGSNPELSSIESILFALTFLNIFFELPQLTPNAWSIAYEVWYYFSLYFVVSLFVKKEKLNILHLVAILIFIWFVIMKPITIYFISGAVLSANINSVKVYVSKLSLKFINLTSVITLVVLLYFVALGSCFGNDGWGGVFTSSELLLPIAMIVIISLLIRENNLMNSILKSKFLLFLGNISYTLYLLHPYTYRLCREIIVRLNISNDFLSFTLFLFLTFVITIAVSHMLSKLFEIPIYRFFSKKEVYK